MSATKSAWCFGTTRYILNSIAIDLDAKASVFNKVQGLFKCSIKVELISYCQSFKSILLNALDLFNGFKKFF